MRPPQSDDYKITISGPSTYIEVIAGPHFTAALAEQLRRDFNNPDVDVRSLTRA